MSDDQISLPYLAVILVVSGLIIRYLFFSGPPVPRATRSPEAFLRSREAAVERIQQMFPQAERRSILWDLQRNGGNIQNTTERILAGRLETVCPHYKTAPMQRDEGERLTDVWLPAPGYLPAAPSARTSGVELELRFGDETAREAGATGPDLAVQPQGEDPGGVACRGCGGRGGGQGQEEQGVELEPRRAAGVAAAEAG